MTGARGTGRSRGGFVRTGRHRPGGRPNHAMVIDHRQDLRVFPSWWARSGLVLLLVVFLATPFQVEDAWLKILTTCGCFAIAAIGLNILTGFTGQVSIGHAFFVAVGGYVAANIGTKWVLTIGSYEFRPPLVVWLLSAALIGAFIGSLIGPFALRLRGNYLSIVTLALLFFSQWLFNRAVPITGGGVGTPVDAPLAIGPFDFGDPGGGLVDAQTEFWLVWGIVALAALVGSNLVRSRAGRAMQAIRDHDLAAEICGVSQFRTKMGAFAWSSAFAAVGGGLYYALSGFIGPNEVTNISGLIMSITLLAMIIIGGLGTIHGSIIGAIIVVGLPRVIDRYSGSLGFLTGKHMSIASFNNILFGVFIIVFLLAEPLGVANLIRRVKNYFRAWPFSY